MAASAYLADMESIRIRRPRWVWIVSTVARIVLLACCGAIVYLSATRQEREATEIEARERTRADDLKYGKEDDAKQFAKSCYRPIRRGGGPVMHLGGLSPDQVAESFGKLGQETQAKLDRVTGHWTVTGIVLRERKGFEADEADWEAIVNYTPSDGLWHQVGFKLDEEESVTVRLPNGQELKTIALPKFHPRKQGQQ